MKKYIKILCFVQLFIVFPLLYVALGWFPERLEVEARTDKGTAVFLVNHGVTISGEQLEAQQDFTTIRYYIPHDNSWRELELCTQESAPVHVRKVSRILGSILKIGYHPKALCACSFPLKSLDFDGLGIARTGFTAMVALVEFAVLLLCGLIAAKSVWTESKPSLLACFMTGIGLTLFFAVIAPIQAYLSNRDVFEFATSALAKQLGFRFLCGVVASTFLMYISSRAVGNVVISFCVALVACGYLETGVLSLGLPELDGNIEAYGNQMRAWIDSGIWVLIFVSVVAFTVRSSRRGLCFMAIVLVLSASSLFDLKRPVARDDSKLIVSNFVSKESALSQIVFAPSNNVLLIVLDAVTTEQAKTVVLGEDKGEFENVFQGFVFYENNVGMASYTMSAVAGMLTGEYYTNPFLANEYYESIFSSKSVLRDALEAHCDVTLVPGSYNYAYSSRSRESLGDGKPSECCSPMTTHLDDLQEWSLDELVRFRVCPYALKSKCLLRIGEGWRHDEGTESEAVVFPILAQAKLDEASKGTFAYIHTHGTHIPITCDRHGVRLSHRNDTLEGATEQAHFVFKKFAEFVRVLQRRKIYDSTMIIVCADHGEHFSAIPKDESSELPKCAFPMLWIKPAYSHLKFSVSDMPTSHSCLAELMRDALRKPLNREDVEKIIRKDSRLFRINMGGRYKDWIVDARGEHKMNIGDFVSPSDLKALEINHTYSLLPEAKSERIDLLFSNADASAHPGRMTEGKVLMTFKVPEATAVYSVSMELRRIPSPFASYDANSNDPFGLVFSSEHNKDLNCSVGEFESRVVLSHLRPNADGTIAIQAQKHGKKTMIDIVYFTIEKE